MDTKWDSITVALLYPNQKQSTSHTALHRIILGRRTHASEHNSRITHCCHQKEKFAKHAHNNCDNESPKLKCLQRNWVSNITQENYHRQTQRQEKHFPVGTHNGNKGEIVMFQLVSPEQITIPESTSSLRICTVSIYWVGLKFFQSRFPRHITISFCVRVIF